MSSDSPFVSVVVAARHSDHTVGSCVHSLLRQSYPPELREIIVVDQGSRGAADAAIDRYPVVRLREPRPGICRARNRGIAASRGDLIAFTDPDCAASTTWMTELVNGFGDQSVGAVAGAIVPYPSRSAAARFAARYRSHSQERALLHPRRPFALTPNLAVRRQVFDRIGVFDTRFPGGGWEDADLCWRLNRQTPFRLVYAPRAVVFHRYRETAWEFLVQHYRYGYALGLLRRKYGLGRLRAAGLLPGRGALAWSPAGSSKRGDASTLDASSIRFLRLIRALGQSLGARAAAFHSR